MSSTVLYAMACALAFGVWNVLHSAASKHINGVLGAMIISAVAIIPAGIILLPGYMQNEPVHWEPRGILFTVLTGLCAFAVDYFALKTFSDGVDVSLASPIIIGGAILISTLVGFGLGEAPSVTKFLGVGLIVAGVMLIAPDVE